MIAVAGGADAQIHSSRSFPISQARIDQFAECTEDTQWIHTDPARAASESPFGHTIAHGYLTLALITPAHFETGVFPSDARQIVNYGFDKVRFFAPVKEGSAVRVDVELLAREAKASGELYRTRSTLVDEASDKAVAVADALFLIVR